MIAYLKGHLLRKNQDYIVLKVQEIGYKIYLPESLTHKLPEINKKLELHIYHYVREDDISLYGFATVEELELFEQLLGVSRIGPKVALKILATASVRDFKMAILNGEVKTLKEVKGIGKKTAQRLILELQEKIDLDNIVDKGVNETIENGTISDAIEALVSLGYQKGSANKVVTKVCDGDKCLSVEEIIKRSLGYLSS